MTFFGDSSYCFPEITDEGQIDVAQFLRASRRIVKFIEALGATFSPVRSDVSGNIESIQRKYNMDPVAFTHFEAMIVDEQENKTTDFLCISGLWLKRGLHFMCSFLTNMLEEYRRGNHRETLQPHISKAYDETLRQYHGWFVQKIFTVVSITAPSWTTLMKTLVMDSNLDEEQVIKDLDVFLKSMSTNLEVLSELFIKYKLDSEGKV